MRNEAASETTQELSGRLLEVERREKANPRVAGNIREIVGPWSYRAKTGKGTIRLTSIEYRILELLASRPYHAFSRHKIAAAVSTETQRVTVDQLGRYVRSLRRQLGFYGDLIQSVPYIGYRFKA